MTTWVLIIVLFVFNGNKNEIEIKMEPGFTKLGCELSKKTIQESQLIESKKWSSSAGIEVYCVNKIPSGE